MKDELATKKDLSEFFKEVKLVISEQAERIIARLQKLFDKVEKKLDLIHKETTYTRTDLMKTQRYILEKLKGHEKRIKQMESEYWNN